MFSVVHFGYQNGVRCASTHGRGPFYGHLFSDRVEGLQVLNLWPFDVPVSGVIEGKAPLATLWRPQLSVVLQVEFAVSGLERMQQAGKAQWLAQRWMVQPTSREGIVAALERDASMHPRQTVG